MLTLNDTNSNAEYDFTAVGIREAHQQSRCAKLGNFAPEISQGHRLSSAVAASAVAYYEGTSSEIYIHIIAEFNFVTHYLKRTFIGWVALLLVRLANTSGESGKKS
jgi:hypothetical protein